MSERAIRTKKKIERERVSLLAHTLAHIHVQEPARVDEMNVTERYSKKLSCGSFYFYVIL